MLWLQQQQLPLCLFTTLSMHNTTPMSIHGHQLSFTHWCLHMGYCPCPCSFMWVPYLCWIHACYMVIPCVWLNHSIWPYLVFEFSHFTPPWHSQLGPNLCWSYVMAYLHPWALHDVHVQLHQHLESQLGWWHSTHACRAESMNMDKSMHYICG